MEGDPVLARDSKREHLEGLYRQVRDLKSRLKELLGKDGFKTTCLGQLTIEEGIVVKPEVREEIEKLREDFHYLMFVIHSLQE
jgi:hypothetical protein